MQTTININDEQLATAQELTGIKQKPALIHAALSALIERENACRISELAKKAGIKESEITDEILENLQDYLEIEDRENDKNRELITMQELERRLDL